MTSVDWAELARLCHAAVVGAGADARTAEALTDAAMAAERRGNGAVGVVHLLDFLEALREGRLNGRAHPVVRRERPSVVTVSADDGPAQLAFRTALPTLLSAVRQSGVAVLAMHDSFPVGELGYYTHALAEAGLVALASANSTLLMSVYEAAAPITGTNPLSFAIPGDPPRLIDQASSAVAWVKIRDAAASGESIPLGWALDEQGAPTTDASAALHGPVLPFGGVKGSNIAMVMELLAVLSGATFALDAPDFRSGDRPPRVGLFLVAFDASAFSSDYLERVELHLERLRIDYDVNFGRNYRSVERPSIAPEILQRLADWASFR